MSILDGEFQLHRKERDQGVNSPTYPPSSPNPPPLPKTDT